MARLDVPHHPDRVFKDEWWDGWQSASGYRALATDNDPLEAFAVVLDSDSERCEVLLGSSMLVLSKPFVRVETWKQNGWAVIIGFYDPH